MTKCDPEIYEHGVTVCMLAGAPAEVIEGMVRRMARDSGQRMDWHYIGGRANVLVIGDVLKAQEAAKDVIENTLSLIYHVYE